MAIVTSGRRLGDALAVLLLVLLITAATHTAAGGNARCSSWTTTPS